MVKKLFLALLITQVTGVLICAQSVHLKEIEQTRKKININANWQFQLDKVPANFASPVFDDSGWESISVPHTMQLEEVDFFHLGDEAYHQFFQRYIGWYRKTIRIEAQPNQKVFLEFEGAHQVTRCWVNGQFVGEHAIGGYTPFHFDITSYVVLDRENTIVLSVDNRPNPNIPPDGDDMDYIKYSGLYRDVYLVITNPVYVTFPWEDVYAGVFVTTPSVTRENATVQVRSTVRNAGSQSVHSKLLTRIIDADGYVIRKVSSEKKITPQADYTFMQTTGITEDLHLWSIDDPYLYRVQTLVYVNNELVDLVENPLGVRKLEFRKGTGFLLNDEVIELIGANKHQNYPYIGDAVPDALLIKDAIQFKEAGFNVVRLAHYPHDNAFIKACDRLGILVIEEAPTWIAMRRGEWFDNLIEANRRMIRNHRNHPSIIMWSGGMNHRGPVEQLHYSCKEEDPTRVTGSNGSPWSGPRNSGVADIYTPMDYQNFGIKDIDLSFLCEHGSSVNAHINQFEISLSRQSASRFGLAMWTAHDYISFKRDWGMVPRRPFSIFRVPNPPMYWYQSEMLENPMVYIADERASVGNTVHVFSNCDEVALYNNGQLVALQRPDTDPERMYCNSPSYTFTLPGAKGDLYAEGFIRNQIAAEYLLNKPGLPYQLKLEIADVGIPFEANGWDMRTVHAYILDKEGNHVVSDTSEVHFTVKGAGEIIGDASIGANPNKAYWGTATALLQSTQTPGSIAVLAEAEGLKPAKATITTTAYETNRSLAETQVVYDYPIVRVDMGKPGQLEQFTWHSWNATDTLSSSYVLPEIKGAGVTITAENSSLKWTSQFGMSGNLPYLAMDGVEVSPQGNMTLTFSDLPKGIYELTSYHHSHAKIDNVKGFAILIKKPNTYQLSTHDATGIHKGVTEVEPTSGSMMDNRYPAQTQFMLVSNGKDEVKIELSNLAQDIPIVLNGFELRRLK